MKRLLNHLFNSSGRKKSEFIRLPGVMLTYCSIAKKYNASVIFTSTGVKKSELRDLLLILLLLILAISRALGQDAVKNVYSASYITVPPAIDGTLNDEAWNAGSWCNDFTQYEPFNNRPASQKTSFKLLYDDNNLYAAIRAFDTHPDSVVHRLTRRDQVEGDVVALVIDSYHDLRTGFFFAVSAAGVKYDLLYTNDGQNQDATWDPNWRVRTSADNEGWTAEIKIPLSQIRFSASTGDIWGLQVARLIYRYNEIDYWQHIPKDAPGLIHMFGELKGIGKIKPREIFDITPYVLARAGTYKADKTNPFRSSGRTSSFKGGIDSKIGITNNMTMDLTINPDFGQVEADPSVVNLTAFETFYKEKRPFFVEGSNITDFNLGIGDERVGNDNLFYSRRIGRKPQSSPADLKSGWIADVPQFTGIIGAAKLTGKTRDGLSVGFIDAVTSEENAEIDTTGGRIYRPVEPVTNYTVGRIQKDINSGNTIIGGILTGTNRVMDSTLSSLLHRSAYTGGLDFTQYFSNKSWMISLNSAMSIVNGTTEAIARTQESAAHYYQRPDNGYAKYDTQQKSLTGSGGRLEIMKLNGHLNLMGVFLWKTPGFETNDLGYMRQADQMIGILSAGYNQWEPRGIYRKYSVSCAIYNMFDFGGDDLVKGIEPNANMTFRNYWSAYISGSMTTNQLSTTILRGGPLMKLPGSYQAQSGFSSDSRRRFILSASTGISGQYMNSSDSRYLNFTLQFKPTDYLMISFSPQASASDDQLQYISTTTYNDTPRYVFGTIHQKTISASLRANITVTPDLSIQYWGQPFFAAGKYSGYKYITDPAADHYNDRFRIFSDSQISDKGSTLNFDENEDGYTDYNTDNKDFNCQAFLSNLVIRWEYNPGSSVYFVWSQTRNGSDSKGMMDVSDLGSLFRTRPSNIFLIKFSYRFGLK